MQVLSFDEMNHVSGAYSWNSMFDIVGNAIEAAASIAIGAAGGFAAGAVIGGKHGGDGGGLLGFGAIGQGVGMVGAGIIGAVTMGICAGIVGFDMTLDYGQKALEGYISGVWVP